MSASLERDVTKSLDVANRAMADYQNWLQIYNLHVAAFRWKEAEEAREYAIVGLECFMDNFAAAYRRLEIARN